MGKRVGFLWVRLSNPRNWQPYRATRFIERHQPRAHAFANGLDFNPTVSIRERIEPAQCSTQQRCSAPEILPMKVVKCRRDLDQRLEKCLFRLLAPRSE